MSELIQFGRFRLIPAEHALFEDGRRVRVGSRAFDILLALVERAGEIVSSQALLTRVWPGISVEDATLRVHLVALRKLLGDGQDGGRFIVNVPGRGYKFAGTLTRGAAEVVQRENGRVASMPAPLNRLIGREETVAQLADRLMKRRLVTIIGPGGIGKTSVAVAVAARASARYRDGARFVDFGSLVDPALLYGAVASALDVRVQASDPIDGLVAALAERAMLLVLDTCEHVVDICAQLVERLRANAPDVHILATSREPLRVTGEWVYRLLPLGVPPQGETITASEALAFPAVALFCERSDASQQHFVLGDDDVASVADICHRLDGIPLAIELAAARIDAFGARGLAARLDDRFALLTNGRRSALPRHQKLRATLDWSYGLLPDIEQLLLLRLSVFRAGFSMKSAASIANCPVVGRDQVMEGVANLVDKSLVAADVGNEPVRYHLLDTTRAYAADALVQRGTAERIARRHASHVCDLFSSAEASWETMTEAQWRMRYADHIDDVRAALDWAFADSGDREIGMQLTAYSSPLWFVLSLVDEYRQRLDPALLSLDGSALAGTEIEVRLLISFGAALFHTGGPESQKEMAIHRALEIATRIGSQRHQLQALWRVAGLCYRDGRYEEAMAFCLRFDAIVEAAPDGSAGLVRDRMMALGYHLVGRHDEARPYAERAMRFRGGVRRAHESLLEYDNYIASRSHLARILWAQGLSDQAAAVAEDAVQYGLTLGYPPPLCYVLTFAACPIAFWRGDMAAAGRYVELLSQHSVNFRSDTGDRGNDATGWRWIMSWMRTRFTRLTMLRQSMMRRRIRPMPT